MRCEKTTPSISVKLAISLRWYSSWEFLGLYGTIKPHWRTPGLSSSTSRTPPGQQVSSVSTEHILRVDSRPGPVPVSLTYLTSKNPPRRYVPSNVHLCSLRHHNLSTLPFLRIWDPTFRSSPSRSIPRRFLVGALQADPDGRTSSLGTPSVVPIEKRFPSLRRIQ